MHCYFDIFVEGEVLLDLEGIEVKDLDEAIAQAKSAIEEVHSEEGLVGVGESGSLVVVRIRIESIFCIITLAD